MNNLIVLHIDVLTARKDWMTTRNRLVTAGETADIQERLVQGCKGSAAPSTAAARKHPSHCYRKSSREIPPRSPERGGE